MNLHINHITLFLFLIWEDTCCPILPAIKLLNYQFYMVSTFMPNILEPQRWNLKWNVYSLDSASRACHLECEGGNEAALTDVPLRRRRDSASDPVQRARRQPGRVCLSSVRLVAVKLVQGLQWFFICTYITQFLLFLSVLYLWGGRFSLAKIIYYFLSPI